MGFINIVQWNLVWNLLSQRCNWLSFAIYSAQSVESRNLGQVHNSLIAGHLGRKKTLGKLLQRFYWFNVREDVHMWLVRCDVCASVKPPRRIPRAPLGKMQVGATLDRFSTDFLGPLPLTPRGNHYILLASDHFTK